jgi:hypothetical protein
MRVVVVLQAETAQEMQSPMRGGSNEDLSTGATDLQSLEDELGINLTPMYPGQSHPSLAPFYFIDVPDQSTAESVISRLKQSASVDAAYVQPEAELPGEH